jgi:hypothetical protein
MLTHVNHIVCWLLLANVPFLVLSFIWSELEQRERERNLRQNKWWATWRPIELSWRIGMGVTDACTMRVRVARLRAPTLPRMHEPKRSGRLPNFHGSPRHVQPRPCSWANFQHNLGLKEQACRWWIGNHQAVVLQ